MLATAFYISLLMYGLLFIYGICQLIFFIIQMMNAGAGKYSKYPLAIPILK